MSVIIDDFEDGDLDEYSGDTAAYTVSTANPFEGDFSLELSTTSPGSRTITRTDVSWGPGDESTLQCWIDREHSSALLFGVQNADSFYFARLTDADQDDTAVEIAKSDNGFTSLSSADLDINRTQFTWLRVVVDWETDGTITVTVYDQTATNLGSVTATDTTYGAGGVGVDNFTGDSTTRTTYLDTIETVSIASAAVPTHEQLSGVKDIRTTLRGSIPMETDQNTSVVQGDTHILDVTVTQRDGTPVDLTDTAIEYTLAKPGDGITATKTRDDDITVTDAVAGAFEVAFTPTQTAALTGRYQHEAELTDSSGDVATVFSGRVFTTEDLDT
jgi:hypothetical protein